jgi:hypothetical protein
VDESDASTDNVIEIGKRVGEDLMRDLSEFLTNRAGPVFERAGACGGPEALRDLSTAFGQALRGFADALEATVVTGLEALDAAAVTDQPLPSS